MDVFEPIAARLPLRDIGWMISRPSSSPFRACLTKDDWAAPATRDALSARCATVVISPMAAVLAALSAVRLTRVRALSAESSLHSGATGTGLRAVNLGRAPQAPLP